MRFESLTTCPKARWVWAKVRAWKKSPVIISRPASFFFSLLCDVKQLSKAINYGGKKFRDARWKSRDLDCWQFLDNLALWHAFKFVHFEVCTSYMPSKHSLENHKAVGHVARKMILLLRVRLGLGTVKTFLMALSKLHNYMALHY